MKMQSTNNANSESIKYFVFSDVSDDLLKVNLKKLCVLTVAKSA